jgi:hypothetical protein
MDVQGLELQAEKKSIGWIDDDLAEEIGLDRRTLSNHLKPC